MNKRMQTVLQSKYFYIAVSVIVAIAIWIIALNTINPVVENTMDVSIVYLNEDAPAEKNLSRTSELDISTATIKVSGRQNTINNLLASEIKIYIDFADVSEIGVTHLKVSQPQCDRFGVKILDYYPKEVDVSYDTKTEMYLNVKTEYTNDVLAEGFEFISVKAEPDSVPISGFVSDIEGLDYIKVSLSDNVENGTINSNRTISLLGRYITNSGHDVTANFEPEKITVKIEVAKRVPITYTVVGSPREDCYLLKHGISSETVLLQGDSDVVSKITEIDLGEIDITGISEKLNRDIDLKDYLPSGVTIYGDSIRYIVVDVESYVTKQIEMSLDDISQPGKNDAEYEYDIRFADSLKAVNNKVKVTIKGKAADIENMTIGSLTPVLDLSDKNIGSYRNQNIVFTVPENVTVVGEYPVNIEVSLIEVPEPEVPNSSSQPQNSTTPVATQTVAPTGTSSATATVVPTKPVATATVSPATTTAPTATTAPIAVSDVLPESTANVSAENNE
ncbi:MAG: hypothetical protein IJZ94_04725 [Clostridia bacterium]|nr:hypothetical protein [Clostridia bacterium]MBQ8165100.1 hypothetical protein [Clostridia bacterium]